MKTITQWILSAAFAVALVFAGGYAAGLGWTIGTLEEGEQLGGIAQGERFQLTTGGDAVQAGEATATTTKIYQTVNSASASSSITGIRDQGDQIDLNLRAIGSSSASTLNVAVFGSDNGIDYYPVKLATSTSNSPLLVQTGNSIYTWELGTSTTGAKCLNSNNANEVCAHLVLGNFYSKYFKVLTWVTGANAAVWGYAAVREQIPN